MKSGTASTSAATPDRMSAMIPSASSPFPVRIPSCSICSYVSSRVSAAGWARAGMPSAASPSSMSPVSSVTTRSGSYPAIASRFGSKPESSVVGAWGGEFDWSSTATTCDPAPIANSISVEVGESETIRSGRRSRVISVPSAVTVTGNPERSGAVPGPASPAGSALPAHADTTSETMTADTADRNRGPRVPGLIRASSPAERAAAQADPRKHGAPHGGITPAALTRGTAPTKPRGRSPDSRIAAPPSLPRRSSSQWHPRVRSPVTVARPRPHRHAAGRLVRRPDPGPAEVGVPPHPRHRGSQARHPGLAEHPGDDPHRSPPAEPGGVLDRRHRGRRPVRLLRAGGPGPAPRPGRLDPRLPDRRHARAGLATPRAGTARQVAGSVRGDDDRHVPVGRGRYQVGLVRCGPRVRTGPGAGNRPLGAVRGPGLGPERPGCRTVAPDPHDRRLVRRHPGRRLHGRRRPPPEPALARAPVDEGRLDHFGPAAAPAHVDLDRRSGPVGVRRGEVRQSDPDAQGGRERPTGGLADRDAGLVEDGVAGPGDQPVDHADRPESRGNAFLLLSEHRIPTPEVALVERHRPREPGFQRRPVRRDVVAVERIAHLKAKGVARPKARRLQASGPPPLGPPGAPPRSRSPGRAGPPPPPPPSPPPTGSRAPPRCSRHSARPGA